MTVNIARSHSSISASESTVEPRLQLWYYIYINNHLLCLILKPLSNSYFLSKWGMGCYYFGGGGYGNKLFLWDGVLDTELPNCNCAAPDRLPWAGFFLTSTSRRKKPMRTTPRRRENHSNHCHTIATWVEKKLITLLWTRFDRRHRGEFTLQCRRLFVPYRLWKRLLRTHTTSKIRRR